MDKRFNDTYFDAVLMQAFRESAEQEIKNEPTLAELKEKYPPSKRTVKRIKNSLKAQQYKRPIAVLYLQRVAVCILAVVALSFAVLLTSSKVQAAISETVVEWYDKYIVINLGNLEDDEDTDKDKSEDTSSVFESASVSEIEPAYIPEGFELISSVSDEAYKSLTYENMDGMLIVINISNSDETQSNLDNENTEYEEIDINGIKAYSVYSEENHFGSIIWGDSGITVNLSGDLGKDELIKIAKNIKPAEDVLAGKSIGDLTVGYIPEGFELITEIEDELGKLYMYADENQNPINITINNSDVAISYLDIENSEYDELIINGSKAYITYSDKESAGSILWGNSKITIYLYGIVEKETLITIAKNIKPAEDVLKGKTFKDLEITYLPDDLVLNMEFEDDGSRFYLWEKSDDPNITLNINISKADVLQAYLDNEKKTLEETTINGNSAFVSYSEEEHMGTVIWGNKETTVFVDGSFDKETLIKIAKNIKPAEDVLSGKSIGDLTVGYIPDDCVLSTEYEDEMTRDYYYEESNGKYLSVQIAVADVTMISLDNENSDFEETTINANTAFITYSQENQFGSVIWGNSEIVITVSGIYDRETLVKVAKEIK